jgi:hypothetical protein
LGVDLSSQLFGFVVVRGNWFERGHVDITEGLGLEDAVLDDYIVLG